MKKIASIAVILALMATGANAAITITPTDVTTTVAAAVPGGAYFEYGVGFGDEVWGAGNETAYLKHEVDGTYASHKIWDILVQTDSSGSSSGDWTNANFAITLTTGEFYNSTVEAGDYLLDSVDTGVSEVINSYADTFVASPTGATPSVGLVGDGDGNTLVTPDIGTTDGTIFSGVWYDTLTDTGTAAAAASIARMTLPLDAEGSGTFQVYQQTATDGGEPPQGLPEDVITGTITIAGGVPTFTIPGGSLLGDVDGNGVINGFDVDPFVLALTSDEATFDAAYPTGDYWAADCDENAVINGFDVDPFVAILTGPAVAVPEPSSVLLILSSLIGLMFIRKRK